MILVYAGGPIGLALEGEKSDMTGGGARSGYDWRGWHEWFD